MADDLRARIEAALEPHTHNGCLVDVAMADVVDVAMTAIRLPRTGHELYCDGGHVQSVTCAQVATWRRDAARDPWRCWHNPGEGQLGHWFQGQDTCRYDGCGQKLSELKTVTPGVHHDRDPEDAP